MKKWGFLLLLLFVSPIFSFAKKEAPDPLYLATPPLDSSKMEVKMKQKDTRTFNEKFREKLHLPPTKKIYIHNINHILHIFI